MPDERIVAPIRRYWTVDQIDTAYQELLAIDWALVKDKTIIIGKGTEGDSASAQIAVTAENSLEWMAAFETILVERENADAGVTAELLGTSHANFGCRAIST